MLAKMKSLFPVLVLSGGLFHTPLWGTVNISFSANVPLAVQDELIANTTAQYTGTLTKSPYFANTYSFTITGKNPNYQPPASSSPILTSTAFDACIAYGFGNGMDTERYEDVKLINAVRNREIINGTCGGYEFSNQISTNTCQAMCNATYSLVTSTITQRWGYIYSPRGSIVGP